MSKSAVIITPTFNNEDYTVRCFDSIRKNTKNYRIIWIDNGSTDESQNRVKAFLDKNDVPYELIANEENLGFVKATNQGMKRAMELGADYLVLQNNDTEVYEGWLDRMIEVAESDEKIGLVGPVTSPCASWQSVENLKRDNSEFSDLPEYGGDPEKYSRIIRDKYRGKTFEVQYYLAFFSTLIRREVVEKIGFLAEEFGVGFGDDIDYSIRAMKSGWRLVVAKDVFVFHNHRTTFRSIYSDETIGQMMSCNASIHREKHKDFHEKASIDKCLSMTAELENKLAEAENVIRKKDEELAVMRNSKFWRMRGWYMRIMNVIKFFPKKEPKLIMTILAKNEGDIIRQNIEFHLKHGVDFIIATDNNSTDATREILEKYEKKGKLFLIEERGDNKDQRSWVNRMGKMALNRFKADLIIHNDADEFWISESGNLKKDLEKHADADVLIVGRTNVILENKGGAEKFPEDAKYAVINPINSDNPQEESRNTNIYFFKLGSKVAFRTERAGCPDVIQGNHAISSGDVEIVQKEIDNVNIYHFPVRSMKHFEKKVAENGSAVERNNTLGKETSWHVKMWYKSYKDGHLDKEYEKLVIGREDALKMIKKGILKEISFDSVINQ